MTNSDVILSLSELSVGFKDAIVKNICLEFSKGEIYALIGVNGSGKSTLLKTITGIHKKLDGKIYLDNKEIDEYTLQERSRKVAYVSSFSSTINMTIEELICMGRYPYTNLFGKLGEKDMRIVNEIIDLVGIKHLRRKKAYEISDGERQKAMIARALVQDTELIVLDEPTAYLDLPNRYEITYLLKKLSRERKISVLFSSHDLNIVLQVVDKVLLIHDREIIEGAPEDMVVKNVINMAFATKKIKHDINSGDFVYHTEKKNKIFINGKGTLFDWTLKALNRAGYDCVCNKKGEINVFVYDQQDKIEWVIEKNNDKFVFGTIYELTNFLRNS